MYWTVAIPLSLRLPSGWFAPGQETVIDRSRTAPPQKLDPPPRPNGQPTPEGRQTNVAGVSPEWRPTRPRIRFPQTVLKTLGVRRRRPVARALALRMTSPQFRAHGCHGWRSKHAGLHRHAPAKRLFPTRL